MEFKIDMSKVVKIVVEKSENSFVEYTIKDGTIVDASIVSKKSTIEDKVDDLKKNNSDVQKISKLIEFDKAGILDQMVKTGSDSVFKTIANDIVNNPIETELKANGSGPLKEVSTTYKLGGDLNDAAKIMKLEEQMDEVAKANRDKIADKIFSGHENADKELFDDEKTKTYSDRIKRIDTLKKIITNINLKK